MLSTEAVLGSLLVRDVDDDLIVRLKSRAVANGRSAEAEHCGVLRRALAEDSMEVPFGVLRGKIRVPAEFDETPAELIEAMERGAF